MKQVLQFLDSGRVEVRVVPVPAIEPHQILVETRASLVSAGTERMLVEFGRASLLGKVRSQPDRARQVLAKVRADGLLPTMEAVRSKLREPVPIGYCSAGVVRQVGASVPDLRVGDRVATNGAHAEWVRVPHTLAARIPPDVSDEAACFAPLGSVALQGIRLVAPELGETVVVFGLGLVGLLTVQLLRASGCQVLGIDLDEARRDLARTFGAAVLEGSGPEQLDAVMAATEGRGADAVLLTLASKASEPVNLAAEMTRPKGRVVLVGVTGLELNREPFFRKELTFAVSCSYGPGRYDAEYLSGRDISPSYLRWSAKRNFAAVLDQMASGGCDPRRLISHRIPLAEAPRAYDILADPSAGSLGVVLQYDGVSDPAVRQVQREVRRTPPRDALVAGVIGAGHYARRTLLPLLADAGFSVKTVVSHSGTDASVAGELVDAPLIGTDGAAMLADPAIGVVFVLTRHDSHAALCRQALEAGKHVFVEKPLALHESELADLAPLADRGPGLLTTGFNRRFAPLTQALRQRLANRSGPLSLVCAVNAGPLPPDHWLQRLDSGGGRIVGEASHFIDLARRLTGSAITDLRVAGARDRAGSPIADIAHLGLEFADGSVATIIYSSNGARSFPKETIQCSCDGATYLLENWRRLKVFGRPLGGWRWPGRADKGHRDELRAWRAAIQSGEPPIPYHELFEVSRWAIRAETAARRLRPG